MSISLAVILPKCGLSKMMPSSSSKKKNLILSLPFLRKRTLAPLVYTLPECPTNPGQSRKSGPASRKSTLSNVTCMSGIKKTLKERGKIGCWLLWRTKCEVFEKAGKCCDHKYAMGSTMKYDLLCSERSETHTLNTTEQKKLTKL